MEKEAPTSLANRKDSINDDKGTSALWVVPVNIQTGPSDIKTGVINKDNVTKITNEEMNNANMTTALEFKFRGECVAGFKINNEIMICLPQAYELFLKQVVGGLHTIYTKLRRLNIQPIVCNVEQVRALRNLGAIQSGVNRCKLITMHDFNILHDDCINLGSRPGRPPKRSLSLSYSTSSSIVPSKYLCQKNTSLSISPYIGGSLRFEFPIFNEQSMSKTNEVSLIKNENSSKALTMFETFQNVAAQQNENNENFNTSKMYVGAEAELITTQQQLYFIQRLVAAAAAVAKKQADEVEQSLYNPCNQQHQQRYKEQNETSRIEEKNDSMSKIYQHKNNGSLREENNCIPNSENYHQMFTNNEQHLNSSKRNLCNSTNLTVLVDVENSSNDNSNPFNSSNNESENETDKTNFYISSSESLKSDISTEEKSPTPNTDRLNDCSQPCKTFKHKNHRDSDKKREHPKNKSTLFNEKIVEDNSDLFPTNLAVTNENNVVNNIEHTRSTSTRGYGRSRSGSNIDSSQNYSSNTSLNGSDRSSSFLTQKHCYLNKNTEQRSNSKVLIGNFASLIMKLSDTIESANQLFTKQCTMLKDMMQELYRELHRSETKYTKRNVKINNALSNNGSNIVEPSSLNFISL